MVQLLDVVAELGLTGVLLYRHFFRKVFGYFYVAGVLNLIGARKLNLAFLIFMRILILQVDQVHR